VLSVSTSTDTIAPPLPGLNDDEAARRRAAGQGNEVQIRTGRTYGRIVRDNVFNFINNLFYVLGIILVALHKPLDAFVVVFVIVANTVISLVQEIRAKRVMDRIAILMRPKATLVRDGRLQDTDPSQIVRGDILYVHPGDQIVVDGPMLGAGRMEVDESLLTGESDLVTKHPGDALLSGSFCMTGGGFYEAQKVGLESFANKLTAKATAFKRELTPLQRQVNQIVRALLIVVIVFEILVWVRNTIGGVPFVESVRMATVILALIPNGLVLSIALTYALGAVRLLGKDMLVQQFNAVESLSNVDVLCTDKTGTLTSGVIKLEETLALGAEKGRLELLLGAFAASTTDANRTIAAVREALPAQRRQPVHEALFSSARKWSGLAFADSEARGTYVLGAPEILAAALPGDTSWQSQADAWAARGLRVVLFAGTSDPVEFCAGDRPPALPGGLRALGLACFSDELRPGVRKTLDEFTEAGIEVKILSGDNPRTVTALATQAGVRAARRQDMRFAHCEALRSDDGQPVADRGESPEVLAVAGADLDGLTPDELADVAQRATIFGRVTPENKQDLVEGLRHRGRYVAMVGDGVNDVVALKQANVAVGMQGGSQAARGVADLILLNDTFAPLPFAFKEGQRIINGMNDILRIFMVRLFFKASIIAVVMAVGGFPFEPRQASLLSFVGAGVPAAAFAVLAIPGPTPKLGLFRLLARFFLPTTLLMTIMAAGVYLVYALPARRSYLAAHPGANTDQLIMNAYPHATTALTLFSCFTAILLMLLAVPHSRWWDGGAAVRGDWRVPGIVVLLLGFMAGVLALPLARTLFELSRLPVWQYLAIFGLAVAWSQLVRLVWRSGILDRWLGTVEDPGNLCAHGVELKPV
jgi:cation-transporting P-type ATPase E